LEDAGQRSSAARALHDVPIRAACGSTSKALVGNAGYRRYLKTIRDEQFDGIFPR